MEEFDNALAYGREAETMADEQLRGDALLVAKQAEQQVLGANVVVQQPI